MRGWRVCRWCATGAALLAIAGTPPGAAPASAAQPRRHLAPVRQWDNGWSTGAVFYEAFVRSFADSDGDGIGDLRGLIGKLDYLNDGNPSSTTSLGVDAIWLMPVFGSPSYHGYDVSDYENVSPAYGSDDDFAQLCQEAHRRGMRVILDFVMNHTSSEHPWFVSAASSSSSPTRDWYVWSPSDLGWRQPWDLFTGADTWHLNPADGDWYYGMFWSGMPDLNYRNPGVRVEMERLAELWLDRGADGFRLDAARYLIEDGSGTQQQDTPETHAFWREFATEIRTERPDATMVGEVWADTPTIARYYGSTSAVRGGDELPMCFDFPLAAAIVAGVNGGSATGIAATLAQVQAAYPPGAEDAPFLTNHDMIRVATQLANSPGRLRNAAAILLTLPGSPFVYYGEEVGLQNGGTGSDDVLKRTPMPWDNGSGFTTGTPWTAYAPGRATANVAAETGDPGSLLSRYRALIRARHASPALLRGDLETLPGGNGTLLAFLRATSGERVLAVHNLGDSLVGGASLTVAGTSADTLFADGGASLSIGGGSAHVTLPPRGSGIWRLH